ncbi:MAG: hypothetical protein R6W84_10615, partial [Promethearchaeia archaeon]
MSDLNELWAWPWWTIMVIINLVNIVVCGIVYKHSLISNDGKDSKYRNWMRIMGVIFTLVGLYRSVFVSKYGPQLAWFDLIMNSALLVRLFAMAAELSFSGLIAFAMIKFNNYLPPAKKTRQNKLTSFINTKSPYILVICIFLAQFFATSGLITKSELLFAIEETLWLVGFISILPLVILQLRRVLSIKDKEKAEKIKMLRVSTLIIFIWCIIYSIFMVFLNLPGIWADAINQIETGIPAIKTGLSAIIDAFSIINVTRLYSDWGFGFLIWHSGYFTLLVWISIYLMQAPRPRE